MGESTMADKKLHKKIIDESTAAVMAVTNKIKEKRGQKFKIEDAKPYVDAVNNMKPIGDQKKEIFDLHVNSVNYHYNIFKDITDWIKPADDPFVEHYQTPPILEILYDELPDFRASVDTFIESIEDHRDYLGKFAVKRYGGMFGPTCVVDFAVSAGSVASAVNSVLRETDIPAKHKEAILACKSWGMNTSYGFGAAFTGAIEEGKKVSEAVDAEIERIKNVYDKPVETQATLMDELGVDSYDFREYMSRYKKKIKPDIKAAMDAGVNLGALTVVPAYCVGTVGHHIAQSTFNMMKDDMTMAIQEAVDKCLVNTLKNNVDKFESPLAILRGGQGATACAVVKILRMDGFSVPMVIDLLNKRFYNYVNLYPGRSMAAELHNVDFCDLLHTGEKKMTPVWQHKKDKPTAGGVDIDLSPVDENEVIQNPQRYTYPGCAITVHFSSLMRLADFPCMLTTEEYTATVMTNIWALSPDKCFSPVKACKDCAFSYYSNKRPYCNWHEAV